MPPELLYVALLFALFVLTKPLQRFRIPSAIVSFALGVSCGLGHHLVNLFIDDPYPHGLFFGDPTVNTLGTLGIVALFLFAGLEIDLDELRAGARTLGGHLALRSLLLAGVSYAIVAILGVPLRPALVVGLAIVTPSTGFIINSIDQLGLEPDEAYSVKTKAIASEILALGVLFVVLKSETAIGLGLASLALIAMVALLPVAFRGFAKLILPYAPKSEFTFLVMVAVVCAYLTKLLGVYYLVGAFIVGIAAQRFHEQLPSLSSHTMMHAVELFASFFIPFYFFKAGLQVEADAFSAAALLAGGVFLAVALPLRVIAIVLQRGFVFKELAQKALRVAVPMLPTLVFTLVLAGILRDRFADEVPQAIIGGLIIYAVVNTVLPGVLIKSLPTIEFEAPTLVPGAHATIRSLDPPEDAVPVSAPVPTNDDPPPGALTSSRTPPLKSGAE
ncbi:MAG: cation:proton antiporter [Myxococcota bacterium]